MWRIKLSLSDTDDAALSEWFDGLENDEAAAVLRVLAG
jgi:hypothetical protein